MGSWLVDLEMSLDCAGAFHLRGVGSSRKFGNSGARRARGVWLFLYWVCGVVCFDLAEFVCFRTAVLRTRGCAFPHCGFPRARGSRVQFRRRGHAVGTRKGQFVYRVFREEQEKSVLL